MSPLLLAINLVSLGCALFGFGAGFLAGRAYYKNH